MLSHLHTGQCETRPKLKLKLLEFQMSIADFEHLQCSCEQWGQLSDVRSSEEPKKTIGNMPQLKQNTKHAECAQRCSTGKRYSCQVVVQGREDRKVCKFSARHHGLEDN